MDVWSTHDWYIDLGELVGQPNITVMGWRGEEGEEKLMNILVGGLDDR
jgi:hypothetical protein